MFMVFTFIDGFRVFFRDCFLLNTLDMIAHHYFRLVV